MTEDEYEIKFLQTNEKLAEANLALGELKGEVKAEVRAAVNDPEVEKLLRAKAWIGHDPEIKIARDLSGLPDGWPPSVEDPVKFLSDWRTEQISRTMESKFPTGPGEAAPPPQTPSVSRLEAYFDG